MPHPSLLGLLRERRPAAILHAGDIGDWRVLDRLAEVAPVLAVRGNIDGRARQAPDVRVIELGPGEPAAQRVLLTHIAVNGPKLRADVVRDAKICGASLVVCGHSHVPFIGRDRGLFVFNPGSAGPRRFGLPIVFGLLEVSAQGLGFTHVDCETGKPWLPPELAPSTRV